MVVVVAVVVVFAGEVIVIFTRSTGSHGRFLTVMDVFADVVAVVVAVVVIVFHGAVVIIVDDVVVRRRCRETESTF